MRAKQIEKKRPHFINDGFSAFIEEIRNGNVLLMVRRGFEANKSVFDGDFYDYVLRRLNSIAGTSDLDFFDISCDNRFLLDKEDPKHIRNLHEAINKNTLFKSIMARKPKNAGTGCFDICQIQGTRNLN